MSSRPAVEVAKGATYFLTQYAVVTIAGILYIAALARLLPGERLVETFGRVVILMIILQFFQIVGRLSLATAANRFAATTSANSGAELRRVSRTILFLALGASVAASLACYLLAAPLAIWLFRGESIRHIQFLSPIIFLSILHSVLNGYHVGLRRFKFVALNEMLWGLVHHLSPIFLLLVGMGIEGILWGWLVAQATGLTIYLARARELLSSSVDSHHLREILRYTLPLYFQEVSAYASSTVERYLLLLLAGEFALGIYAPAVSVSAAANSVAGSVSKALFPILSNIYGKKGIKGMGHAVLRSTRYLYLAYTPLAIGLAVTAPSVITIFVGPKFIDATIPLVILALSSSPLVASLVYHNLLLAAGKTSVIMKAQVISTIVGLLLAVLAVPWLGATGAAMSRVGITVANFFILMLSARIGQSGPILDIGAVMRSHVAGAVMGIGVLVIGSFLVSSYYLLLYALLGFLIYLAAIRFLKALEKEDTTVILEFMPSAIRQKFLKISRLFLPRA